MTDNLRFVELPAAAMTSLLVGDLPAASTATGVVLTEEFLTEESCWVWRYRLGQLAQTPEAARWILRAVAIEPDGAVVGQAGFHGPPDEAGMVEVGYGTEPARRRQGIATALLAELLRRAAADPSVRVVRASVSPDNAGSLATIAKFGFVKVGEQWDEEDGLELLFEAAV